MKSDILAPFGRYAALCALAVFTAPLAAAPINYGDFDDIPPGSVMYLDVTEDANSPDDAPPLFGAPDVTGDLLDFDPSGFGASASNGDIDITDGQLNFDFETVFGTGISSLLFEEGGDYRFFSGGAATTINFDLIGEVMITEVNGSTANVPSGGIVVQFANSASFSSTGGGPAQFWSLSTLVDLGPALPANIFGPGAVATAGEVFLNNQLIASSEPGSLAFIAKKDFTVTPTVRPDPDNVIPEPTAAALALLAGVGLAARRR